MTTAPRQLLLTALERLELIQTLSELPLSQIGQLEFALAVPRGVMPGVAAPVGERAKALLDWADGPTGPGLEVVVAIAQAIVPSLRALGQPAASRPVTVQLVITFSGQVDAMTIEKLMAILNEVRSLSGDDFLEVLRIESDRGIGVVLDGTPAALDGLLAMYQAGRLHQILGTPVLSVQFNS